MKKISLILIMLAAATLSFGQLNTNRTASTRVADALALLPAQDAVTLDHAMSELVEAGPEGLGILTGMFTDVNNVPVNYALNGLAFYVTADGRETARRTYEEAILDALANAADVDVKRFYFTRLSTVGTDRSVPVIAEYINDPVLCDYALHTLGHIGIPAAAQAVKNAVLEGTADKAALANMAAYMFIDGIYPQLEKWLKEVGEEDRPPVIFAMARSGDKRAVDYFAKAAKADKYAKTENTLMYVEALRSYSTTNPADAAKRAKDLMSKAKKAGNATQALTAFDVYVQAGGSDITGIVLEEMNNPSRPYRNGILNTASRHADRNMFDKLIEKANKSDDVELITDIINFVGLFSQDHYGVLEQYFLLQNDEQVALAAIDAFYNKRDVETIRMMCQVFTGNRPESVIDAGKNFIISCSNEDVERAARDIKLDKMLSEATPYSLAAMVEIAGEKQLMRYRPYVVAAMNESDKHLSTAAYAALAGVSSEFDLPELFQMLAKAGGDMNADKTYIQQAIISVMHHIPADKRLERFRSQMERDGANAANYYILLASTGEPRAYSILERHYNAETQTGKAEVVRALSLGKNIDAAKSLYIIAKEDANKDALAAYIQAIASSDMTPERKYTMYLKASEIADDAASKAVLVREAAKLSIFQALIFCGNYLEDNDARVRDIAAQGVMNIALSNPEWNGPAIVELLNKAHGAVNNPDAEYNRQAIENHLAELPGGEGFVPVFNGRDLTGWKGIVENPIARRKMNDKELAKKQEAADELMRQNWTVENGALVYIGDGYDNIATVKDYGDIEMFLDWRLYPEDEQGDGGIYLRGTPQVQIWDTSRTHEGAEVGSGGLYNNMHGGNIPLVYADNPIGEWNTFRILMKGERVSVWLNGEQVVDNAVLENFWDRSQPLFPSEQIELQGHTTRIAHKNIYVKELPMAEPYTVSDEERAEGFVELFDGVNLDKWYGNTRDYVAEDGNIVLYPSQAFGGNLYTKEEFGDFVLRFEFQLTPAANNGIGIRTPDEGDAAYVGMEIQILDDRDPVYATIADYQSHGSVYGIIAAKRDCLKPVGEWNVEEIYANGNHIRVTLNGVVILDGDIAEASKNGTLDGLDHPGLKNKSGHIAFLGHGSMVKFRNLRIKRLD